MFKSVLSRSLYLGVRQVCEEYPCGDVLLEAEGQKQQPVSLLLGWGGWPF